MTKPLFNSRWVSHLEQYKKLIVGFSGGLDSTVLLHTLYSQFSLRSKLLAVHINHGISPNALIWQSHCEAFCAHFGILFKSESVEFDRSANIEEGARNARYAVFNSLLTNQDCLLLGHHMDDQAETVLLQLFRGAGVDGLAAMMESGSFGSGRLARPLLSCTRQQLEHYAAQHELSWIEDESNQDVHFSRNYIRQEIMPSLIAKWPGVVGNIARAANHCQQARTNLDELAFMDSPQLLSQSSVLCVESLKSFSIERISNVLRVWLKQNQVQLPSAATFQRLIHEAVFASADAMPLIRWDEVQIRRYNDSLYIVPVNEIKLPPRIEWSQFPQPVQLGETGSFLVAQKTEQGIRVSKGEKINIQFRTGGELFVWHDQTKRLKKLFQDWGIPPWLRQNIPLLYINDQLAAVIGYAVSDLFFTNNPAEAWSISMNR